MRKYTAIIHTGNLNEGNEGFVKWRNISSLDRLKKNAITKWPTLKFINIYEKDTRSLIDTWKP